jgi:hypothetical protein
MVSNNELKIGYKNGLGINKFEFEINCKRLNQADSSIRTKEHIQVRTESMIEKIMTLFNLNEIVCF